MLLQLKVSNYALIDELNLDFPEGFTVITGETGSGKSIMLGALGLVLGDRADTRSLRDKERKCIVEATFRITADRFGEFFNRHDLDFEPETVLRREINKAGKSRAFINDTPVTLGQVKELSSQLIDIHSQHQTLLIKESRFQMSVLDSYAKSQKALANYQEKYKVYKQLELSLKELEAAQSQSKADYDYNQFQFEELSKAGLDGANLSELEKELELLNNSEEIKMLAVQLGEGLSGDEAILGKLTELKALAERLAGISDQFKPLFDRLNSAIIELGDLSGEIEFKTSDLEYDQERVMEVNDLVNELNRLLFKHNLSAVDDLIALRDELETKLVTADSLEDNIATAGKVLDEALKDLQDAGTKLSSIRKKAITGLEQELEKMVNSLSMDHAKFKFELTPANQPKINGLDEIEVAVQLNKGSAFLEIEKAASGGELGRIMLALKTILSKGGTVSTIIFDEIDTGVSGEVANRMAELLSAISTSIQVISITHLPQIAGKGQQHFKVYKETVGNTTNTHISLLDRDHRLLEIAEMLSGKDPSEAAVQNARELLN